MIDPGAGAREGKRHPEDRVQRLGDREAVLDKDVGQPCAEPERDAEKRKKADHSGDDPAGIVAEHGRDRIAVCAARRVVEHCHAVASLSASARDLAAHTY